MLRIALRMEAVIKFQVLRQEARNKLTAGCGPTPKK